MNASPSDRDDVVAGSPGDSVDETQDHEAEVSGFALSPYFGKVVGEKQGIASIAPVVIKPPPPPPSPST